MSANTGVPAACWGCARCCRIRRRYVARGAPTARSTPCGTTTTPSGSTGTLQCSTPFASTESSTVWQARCATPATWTSGHALCVVGGGVDGHALAEAFVEAELPPGTTGLVVTGPYMPVELRQRLVQRAQRHPRCDVLEFVPEPAPLINRADRIIAMGGYNTICEVLSFEKHALIIPRVHPEPEQWIRAQRLRDLGLVDVLHPDDLSPRALTDWLARDLGPLPTHRSRVDVRGLTRIPTLMAELLNGAVTSGMPTV